MPKSKQRKDHKKKLKIRQDRIKQEKSKAQKMQRDFIMNLIKQEQEKGLFNNTTPVNSINSGTDGSIIEGPAI